MENKTIEEIENTNEFWDNWKYPDSYTGLDIDKMDDLLKRLFKHKFNLGVKKAQEEFIEKIKPFHNGNDYESCEICNYIKQLRTQKGKQNVTK